LTSSGQARQPARSANANAGCPSVAFGAVVWENARAEDVAGENETPHDQKIATISSRRDFQMKSLSAIVLLALLGVPTAAQQKEKDRVRNAGVVMTEILNIPDDIPQNLLDKA
jgi:hypothetical protein